MGESQARARDDAQRSERAGAPDAAGGAATASGGGIVIGLAAAFGLVVRARGLGRQILIDDEFHAFRAGLRADLSSAYLFTHNTLPEDPLSDFSSPLALWVRLLSATVGVDEWTLRAPGLVCSALLPLVLGFTAWRLAGARAGALAAWLAALSPLLVLYARFARPYAPVAVAAAVALAAATAFRARASSAAGLRPAVALGLALALGAWVNLTALPALAVIGWLGFASALRGRAGPVARGHALRGVGVGAFCVALLLLPASPALMDFAAAKTEAAAASRSTWWGAAQIFAGVQGAPAFVGFAAVVALGAIAAARSAPSLAGLALAALLAQLGAFLLLRPHAAEQPLVIARYLVAALPGVLLLAALGVDALCERVRRPLLAALVPALLLVAWISAGPLPALHARENAYTSRPSSLLEDGSGPGLISTAVPTWYRELAQTVVAAEADELPRIVEAPWVLEWPLALPADYQALHGARVSAWTGFWPFRAPGVRLASQVGWRAGLPDLGEADAVVVHLDLVGEWHAVTGGTLGLDPDQLGEARERYRTDAAALDAWMGQQTTRWRRTAEGRWLHVYEPLNQDGSATASR